MSKKWLFWGPGFWWFRFQTPSQMFQPQNVLTPPTNWCPTKLTRLLSSGTSQRQVGLLLVSFASRFCLMCLCLCVVASRGWEHAPSAQVERRAWIENVVPFVSLCTASVEDSWLEAMACNDDRKLGPPKNYSLTFRASPNIGCKNWQESPLLLLLLWWWRWWLLVVGCWLLVVGCWLLVVGCWLLVVGCWCCCCCWWWWWWRWWWRWWWKEYFSFNV